MSVFQFMLKFTVVLSVENSNLILGFSFFFFFDAALYPFSAQIQTFWDM